MDGGAGDHSSNFGPERDWLKNVAAGGCRLRLGDEMLLLGLPRVVPVEQASADLPRWFALGLRYVSAREEELRRAASRFFRTG